MPPTMQSVPSLSLAAPDRWRIGLVILLLLLAILLPFSAVAGSGPIYPTLAVLPD